MPSLQSGPAQNKPFLCAHAHAVDLQHGGGHVPWHDNPLHGVTSCCVVASSNYKQHAISLRQGLLTRARVLQIDLPVGSTGSQTLSTSPAGAKYTKEVAVSTVLIPCDTVALSRASPPLSTAFKCSEAAGTGILDRSKALTPAFQPRCAPICKPQLITPPAETYSETYNTAW